MNIRRVKYKMNPNEDWKIGYVIGEYEGQNKTLIDDNFEYVPKILDEDREFLVWDFKDDIEKQLNITIPI